MATLGWEAWAAIYAGLVATAALALEVRRWFESGPRLSISIMCPARQHGGPQKDDRDYLAVTVSNRGDGPTSITHFGLLEYPTVAARMRRRQAWAGLVLRQASPAADLPHVLEPGRYWIGMALYDDKLRAAAEKGTLYVGIYAVHYRNSILTRVKITKDKTLDDAKKNPRP